MTNNFLLILSAFSLISDRERLELRPAEEDLFNSLTVRHSYVHFHLYMGYPRLAHNFGFSILNRHITIR